MEFIFGNSGEGYNLLHKSSEKDIAISDYVQKINKFDVTSEQNSYAYRTLSVGKTFKIIFNMCAKDGAFTRGAYYNHVKWMEYDRDYLGQRDFLEDIMCSFASQEDVDKLRQTGKLSIKEFERVYPNNELISEDMLFRILYAIHSAFGKRIIIAIDLPAEHEFNDYARKLMKFIFSYLNINLRITSSYITSCSLELFRNSDYRFCVIPTSFLGKYNENDIIVIKSGETKFERIDDWTEYIKWIVSIGANDRNKFFNDYDMLIGQYESTSSNNLLKYYLAVKENNMKTISELLLPRIEDAINKGEDYSLPRVLQKKLKEYHDNCNTDILSGEFYYSDIESFINNNYTGLVYLINIYGNGTIPELDRLFEENLPNKPDKEIKAEDLDEIESLKILIDDCINKSTSDDNIKNIILLRAVAYITKYYQQLIQIRQNNAEVEKHIINYFNDIKDIESFKDKSKDIESFKDKSYENFRDLDLSSWQNHRFEFENLIKTESRKAFFRLLLAKYLAEGNVKVDSLGLPFNETDLENWYKKLKEAKKFTEAQMANFSSDRTKSEGSFIRTDALSSNNFVESQAMRVGSGNSDLLEYARNLSSSELLEKSYMRDLGERAMNLSNDTILPSCNTIAANISSDNLEKFLNVQFRENRTFLDYKFSELLLLHLSKKSKKNREVIYLYLFANPKSNEDLVQNITQYFCNSKYNNKVKNKKHIEQKVYLAIYSGLKKLSKENIRQLLYSDIRRYVDSGIFEGMIYHVEVKGKLAEIENKRHKKLAKKAHRYTVKKEEANFLLSNLKYIIIGGGILVILICLLVFSIYWFMDNRSNENGQIDESGIVTSDGLIPDEEDEIETNDKSMLDEEYEKSANISTREDQGELADDEPNVENPNMAEPDTEEITPAADENGDN